MIVQDLIPPRIHSIFKDIPALDDISQFVTGIWFTLPHAYFPVCTTVITGEETVTSQIGGRRVRRAYNGFIQFDILIQDIAEEVDSRELVIPSTIQINKLVNAAITTLKSPDHFRLDNLTFETGAVDEVVVGDELVLYSPETRENVHFHVATIPFVVNTWETIS